MYEKNCISDIINISYIYSKYLYCKIFSYNAKSKY